MKKAQSLSFIVTIWTGAVIAASMTVYAVFQFLSMPDMTVKQLFLQHLWHVLSLGIIIYFFCWIAFQRIIVRPLELICLHLYRVGDGKVRTLTLQSKVTEIQSLVKNINLMTEHMKQAGDKGVIEHAQQSIEKIKDLGEQFAKHDEDQARQLFVLLARLEKSLLPLSCAQGN